MMDQELCAKERRLQRVRDGKALLGLAIWAGGGYLLHLGWSVTRELPEPWIGWLGTVIYLIAFFYVFAFWPILAGVERMCPGRGLRAKAAAQARLSAGAGQRGTEVPR
jgi:hypothetical protein